VRRCSTSIKLALSRLHQLLTAHDRQLHLLAALLLLLLENGGQSGISIILLHVRMESLCLAAELKFEVASD